MNPNTIAVIIAVAAFIVSLFAANFLNQRALERMLEQQNKMIEAKLEAVRAEINTLRVELSNLAQRVERIERQLDKIFKPVLPGS